MSIFCPQCGKELNDNDRFCGRCGHHMAQPSVPPVEPVGEEAPAVEAPATEGNFEPNPAPASPEIRTVEQSQPDSPADDPAPCATEDLPKEAPIPAAEPAVPVFVPASQPSGVPVTSVTHHPGKASTPVEAVPLQKQPAAEKKNKYLGLGIALCTLAVLLVAAIVTIVILLIPKGDDAEKDDTAASDTADKKDRDSDAEQAAEEYLNAWNDHKFEDFYGMDYNTVYLNDNLDDAVKGAEEYNSGNDAFTYEMLGSVELTDDALEKEVAFLEKSSYKDTDKIKGITIVNVMLKDDDRVSLISIFAVNVDGKIYLTTGIGY